MTPLVGLIVSLSGLVLALALIVFLIASIVRSQRDQSKFRKRMLDLENERRDIVGLPPIRKW